MDDPWLRTGTRPSQLLSGCNYSQTVTFSLFASPCTLCSVPNLPASPVNVTVNMLTTRCATATSYAVHISIFVSYIWISLLICPVVFCCCFNVYVSNSVKFFFCFHQTPYINCLFMKSFWIQNCKFPFVLVTNVVLTLYHHGVTNHVTGI